MKQTTLNSQVRNSPSRPLRGTDKVELPRITEHAQDRAKERTGLNAHALERIATKALNEGVTHGETCGRLNRYLTKLYLTHEKGNNNRIYGEYIFIFQNNVLITVLQLPPKLKAAARGAMVRHQAK